jgi:hypothetical protein
MVVRNFCAGLLVVVAVTFAQSADTTLKKAAPQQVKSTTISVKSENQTLKKQQRNMPNSTWSKIKDLFM